MIDLHCHYLPAIDDGSQSMAESLDLARASVADGITHAVMTPHIHLGRYQNLRSTVVSATAQFQLALREAGIPLQVYPGGEVRLSSDILDLLDRDEIPFLGMLDGFRVMLLEFPYGQIPVGTEKLLRWLVDHRIRPLIAHPERNKVVLDNVERISPYIEMGCLLQVTAGSITGAFGKPAQNSADLLLERGWVSVIATDAHNLLHRAPLMSQAKQLLCERGLSEFADRMTKHLPAKMLGLDAIEV